MSTIKKTTIKIRVIKRDEREGRRKERERERERKSAQNNWLELEQKIFQQGTSWYPITIFLFITKVRFRGYSTYEFERMFNVASNHFPLIRKNRSPSIRKNAPQENGA